MTMFRRIAALFVAFTLPLAVAPSATAQAVLSDCTAYSNVVCLWKNAGADGNIWRQTTAQVPVTGCRYLSESGWNNEVTTVRLQTSLSYVLKMYDSSNCTGTPVDIYPGFTYDFSGNPWNDKFSSLKLS